MKGVDRASARHICYAVVIREPFEESIYDPEIKAYENTFPPIGIYLASRFIFREPSSFFPFFFFFSFFFVSNLTGLPSNYSCPRMKRSNNFWKSLHPRLPYGATLFKSKEKSYRKRSFNENTRKIEIYDL